MKPGNILSMGGFPESPGGAGLRRSGRCGNGHLGLRMDGCCRCRSIESPVGSPGAALLEVLLALALFVGAAAVVTTALNSSLTSLERQRLNTHAVQLASSVLAEIQLGIRPSAADSPRPLGAPYQDWTCEIALAAGGGDSSDAAPPNLIEVIVRHENPAVVQRLAQVLGRPPATAVTNAPGGSL